MCCFLFYFYWQMALLIGIGREVGGGSTSLGEQKKKKKDIY